MKIEINKPPIVLNYEGDTRRVGLELELTGLSLPELAECIFKLFGGKITKQSDYIFEVRDTDYGSFCVELDIRLLRDMTLRHYFDDLGLRDTDLRDSIENILANLSKTVVPYEVIFPPVRWHEVNIADALREELHERKALGTKASLFYAFGLHMNIETPSFDVNTIINYLRAFLLLYDWLKVKTQADITRKVSPFIDPFPDAYVDMVLSQTYSPSFKNLIEDYISFNPDRNRPLDLLPLFAFKERKLVQSLASDPLIKPRPAFHYRLPNCRVDDPKWRIVDEWNLWVEVENLSVDPEKIGSMTGEYLELKHSLVPDFIRDWAGRVERWLT